MSTPKDAMANNRAAPASELEVLLEAARSLDAEQVLRQLMDLEERTRAQRFYVACLGQFKRGKSTLLNALIRAEVLPTGIVPVTAVPTIVRYGPEPAARIRTDSGEWQEIQLVELEAYVSEGKNPGNCKRTSAVEVFTPNPLLASGMCLVDTPGLGSIFESNTKAMRAFIPHVDAAILVIGADPPLSQAELSLVQEISAHVKNMIFVLNKADRVTDAERLLAKDFARLILEKHLQQKTVAVLEVSATEWLESDRPTRDAAELVRRLKEIAATSGAALAQAAWYRGMQRLCLELRLIIAERVGALTRPIEQSRQRLAILGRHVNAAKDSLRDLAPLLRAEEQAMAQLFAQRGKRFVEATLPSAMQEMRKGVEAVAFRSGPKYRRDLMGMAQEIARKRLLCWLEQEEISAGELYRKTMARFTELAESCLLQIAKSVQGIEDRQVLERFRAGEELTSKSEFRFHDMVRIARPVSPFGLLRDVVLAVVRSRKLFVRDAERFLEQLLIVNSSRVESDFKERVAVSRHALEKQIRALFSETLERAGDALQAAQRTVHSGEKAVETEINRLRRLEESLSCIRGVRLQPEYPQTS